MSPTPYEQIDSVFFFIKDKIELGGSYSKEYIWNLYVSRTPKMKINETLYNEIIERLISDGYIRMIKLPNAEQPIFHVTFDGLVHEGYLAEFQKTQATDVRTRRIERQQFYLTLILAASGVVASAYYILEILDYHPDLAILSVEVLTLCFLSVSVITIVAVAILILLEVRKKL